MSEPTFAIPLSALVEIEDSGDGTWTWGCRQHQVGAWFIPSEAEARSAAIEHLAKVHGLVQVRGRLSADRLARFLRLNYVPGTTRVPWGDEDEELRVAWIEEAIVIIDKVLGLDW